MTAALFLDNTVVEITDPVDVERVERIRRSVFGGTTDKPLQPSNCCAREPIMARD